ncbi:hypothetical protein [Algoriphagus limi]|uniref:DUF3278 domain-containing protein n=1 Tax=Algoriphagus limi TaxID=2975273 RepID=A0ABT2G7Y8_9BACT|nr:hypothetical protein [Algoriphagus limi]MCS5491389.1 hypothetical protein [Algoriphagus limi]
METFDEIQAIYDSQIRNPTQKSADEILSSAKLYLKKLKRDQYFVIGILTLTLTALIFFFYRIGQFGDWKLISGLGMMIGSLVLRVLLEFWSKIGLKRLHTFLSTQDFLDSVKRYYQSRKQIQKVFTPIIYLIYGIGIVLFLIAIQPFLSPIFFAYCVITGLGFWFGFIWVIRKSYRKERDLIEQLSKIGEE